MDYDTPTVTVYDYNNDTFYQYPAATVSPIRALMLAHAVHHYRQPTDGVDMATDDELLRLAQRMGLMSNATTLHLDGLEVYAG